METKQISLQEVIKRLKYSAWLFEKQWLNNHAENPEEWPLQLSLDSWADQFMIWSEQQDTFFDLENV